MKMKKLKVYFNPSGPVAQITQFCRDYAAAIAATLYGDSSAWLALWSQEASNELHQPVGAGVVTGFANITAVAPQNFFECTCVNAWPTVVNSSAAFVFQITPKRGSSFWVLDIITFFEPESTTRTPNKPIGEVSRGCFNAIHGAAAKIALLIALLLTASH
eukprot:TRINITY_DN9868_c0_g2_i1.p1 TRINITY_DN9868_c0_g2~~TRINITY_DN9868_c0_g2_i1.p1  ORF type:complete len:160 (+),score=11.70 TRINITY_DN9868_c0_g2_i1:2-481(+)